MRAADSGSLQEFNVPAGEAEQALKKFAEQSGRQILFPTEAVRGVRTNAIQGRLTARAALELLLSGTRLRAKQDEPAGAVAIRGATRPADGIVELPPFLVEDGPVWSYAKVPSGEVLSRCDDDTTTRLVECDCRLMQLLELILPAQLRVQLASPASHVFFDAKSLPRFSQEIIHDMQLGGSGVQAKFTPRPEEKLSFRIMPNFRFWDNDKLAVFTIVEEDSLGVGGVSLSGGYIRYLLENRTPSLPRWFVEGFTALYESTTLEAVPRASKFDSRWQTSSALASSHSLVIRTAIWISTTETASIIADASEDRKNLLLPMHEIFAPLPEGDHPARAAETAEEKLRQLRRRAQASLFIRWAFDGKRQPHRQALWKFVERASVEPMTGRMFQECFGLSFSGMHDELVRYLPPAIRHSINLDQALPELPPIEPRPATDAEIGRIKGDLERLETSYVADLYPALTPRYREQARRTVRRAHAQAANDPGLLAAMGLCECDAGDDAAARPFLAAAIAGGVVRPRVYFELARIKFDELRPADQTVKLAPSQTADILKLLDICRTQAPPLPEVYDLLAVLWLSSDGRHTHTDLAVLDEGIRLFPQRTRLIYTAALLNSQHGFEAEARALIARGLGVASNPADRARFQKLQAGLGQNATVAKPPLP